MSMETTTRICKYCGKEKPVESFSKNAWGYTNVCKECNVAKRKEAQNRKHEEERQRADFAAKKAFSLNDYTPRELMQELARRGYEGKLRFTRVEEIDITNF